MTLAERKRSLDDPGFRIAGPGAPWFEEHGFRMLLTPSFVAGRKRFRLQPERRLRSIDTGLVYDPVPTVVLREKPEPMLVQVTSMLSGIEAHLEAIRKQLDHLEERLASAGQSLAERPIVRTTTLSDLTVNLYDVKAPIPALLEEYDDGCVARWPEVEASGFGHSEPEAIDHLKHNLVELCKELEATDDSELAAPALSWKRILNRHIQRNGKA